MKAPALLLALLTGCAAPPSLRRSAEPAPPELAEPIRGRLAPEAYHVSRSGALLFDFWFMAGVSTPGVSTPHHAYYGLLPGSLVGVARVYSGASDFKGQKIAPGVYTLRYAVQPDDGDHQDVTESRDFLLLCAAADDRSAQEMGEKDLRSLSARLNGKKHPSVLYLAAGMSDHPPRLATEGVPEKTFLEVNVRTSSGGTMVLGVVVAGKAGD